MTNVADLRLHRIRTAAAASCRAGYRTAPPPDVEADRWVCSVEVSEDEDSKPVHRMIWHPRKEAMDWQHARFGPFTSPHKDAVEHEPASQHGGQERKAVTGVVGWSGDDA